jgi:hypothetical protein
MSRIYINHVREGLAELASEARQRQLWLASAGPLVSSFEEAASRTFDDSGLSVELDRASAGGVLGDEAVRLLRELGRAVDAVDHTLPRNDLIDSVAMERVRALAAAALDAVESRDPIDPRS